MRWNHHGKHRIIVVTISFMFILSGFFVPQVSATNSPAASATATSCPSNSILNMVMAGGAPNTFNFLNVHGPSAGESSRLMWSDLLPGTTLDGYGNYTWNSMTSSVVPNANYTQWTFNIKPGMKWSDGTPVTAQDILNTYSTNYALNSTYDFQNLAGEITHTYAANTTSAVFVLNKSDAQLPIEMSNIIFDNPVPPQWIQQGPSFNGFGVVDVTDGPFYPANYVSGATQAVFLRNPYFQPAPTPCEVIVSYVESDSSVPTLLLSGQEDLARIPDASANTLINGSNPNLHLSITPGLSYELISYNVNAYPYNVTGFRQALAYGINQTAVLDTGFAGYGVTAYNGEGLVPPAATRWFNSNQATYSFDPAHALSLLHSAGFKTVGNTLEYPNGTAVSLKLFVANDEVGNVLSANIVQSNLQALGITITPVVESKGAMIGGSYRASSGESTGLLMIETEAGAAGIPYFDAVPSWDVLTPFKPNPPWIPAGQALNNYNSNLSALLATGNYAQQGKYLNSIQSINSQNLPMLMLAYPDLIVGYSTQRWSNWGNTIQTMPGGQWYFPAFASICQTGSSQCSTATSSSLTTSSGAVSSNTGATNSGSHSATSSGSATNTATSSSAASSSSSSSSTGSNNTTLYIAAAAVVIIIIIAGAAVMMRRGRGGKAPTPPPAE